MVNKLPNNEQIAIFPGLVLNGIQTSNCIQFKDSVITNWSIAKNVNNKILSAKQISRIEKFIKSFKIQDSKGVTLSDFVIVITNKIAREDLQILNRDAEELLKFITYLYDFLNSIHSIIPLDTIKILNGWQIFINNRSPNFNLIRNYTIPVELKYLPKLYYTENVKELFDSLSKGLCSVSTERQTKILIIAIKLYNSSRFLEHRDPYAAVGLMVSALESLFGQPKKDTKKEIANIIDLLLSKIYEILENDNKSQLHDILQPIIPDTINNIYDIKGRAKQNFVDSVKQYCGSKSAIEQWAKEIYDVRSNIYHGSEIRHKQLKYSGKMGKNEESPETRHIYLLEIAEVVFYYILKCKIEDIHLCSKLDIHWKERQQNLILNKIIANKFKIDDILSNKNYTYTNFSKNNLIYFDFITKVRSLMRSDLVGYDLIKKLSILVSNIATEWNIKCWLPEYYQKIQKMDKTEQADFDKRKQNIEILLKTFKDVDKTSKNGMEISLKLLGVILKNPPTHSLTEIDNYDLEEFLYRCAIQVFNITNPTL